MISRISKRNFSFFDKVNRNWEAAWSQNVTPWETGGVTKPLEVEFSKNNFVFTSPSPRALVPGCGSGHDCQFLATQGFSEVIGLDLSQTAINKCQETIKSSSKIKFECQNFFEYRNGKFEFIFDYLFFSALDPSMRNDWANSMKSLLQPNQGILFTLIFPNIPGTPDKSVGPPYVVDLSDYQSVLEPLGFKLTRNEQCSSSIKPRMGKELIAIWKLVE